MPTVEDISVADARRFIRAHLSPVHQREKIFIRQAHRRVLAAGISAPIDVPGSDNAAVDGYAFDRQDLPLACTEGLAIVGVAYAGTPYGSSVPRGSCLRVMTGAVLPASLSVVVMQENVTIQAGRMKLPSQFEPGDHVRRAGEDLQAGQVALRAGRWLKSADIGLLASMGIVEVMVHRRLCVSIVSTGNELISLGDAPRASGVYDSNRYTLYSLLDRLGCEVVDMGVIRDDPAAIEEALRVAMRNSDVLISSGGVSGGEVDHTKAVVGRIGEILFSRVAMKPGRPLTFGCLDRCWFFGLPGNPVAVMVTVHQLVRNGLLQLMGVDPLPEPVLFEVPCMSALHKAPGRSEFQRGRLQWNDGTWQVALTGNQSSAVLRSMSEANCYIVLGPERGPVRPGELVPVQWIED